ncbi:general secretion pathway protein GspB [Paraglaciecola sp. 20A4]|uniref:general secretion pathway protein GspB n=1 Tax=Paraglaciecola sp. 20A4 TaxID=2687288 RepID=UPI001408D14A|nr:general secretion pathway protein GspB [Paraglaciecola sp. 20A4]
MDNLVTIDALLPGMVIVQITQQNGPIKIRKSGLVTSMEMVTGLGEMGVQQVEIDPAQTVEIDKPKVQKSQTQKLLESDRLSEHGANAAVSDQFNRSLFLPSVQALPSRWQYYAKPLVQGFMVICVGFALGWGASVAPKWLDKLDMAGMLKQANNSEQVDLASKVANTNSTGSTEVVAQSIEETKETNNTDTSQIAKPEIVNTSSNDVQPKQNKSLARTNVDPSQSQDRKVNTVDSRTSQRYGTEQSSSRISADLLKRFEKAITEIDNEPDKDFEPTQTKSIDTPRIDQLPAWVLTQLPPMVFSMHMYSSSEQDRWVEVNNRRLHEGDMIDDKVQIEHIEPQNVILNYQGQTFSMSALSEW